MISAEKLVSYLPWYYQESRVMRSIMEAISPEIPDAIGHLWKAFFLHLAKDDEELLRYYREELQAYELAALFAKLRSGGILNKELLASQGIEAVDTHIYSPEGGYVLSGEEAVFPDGVYYAPLITDLQASLGLINIARQLVAEAGTAGIRYWFSTLIQEVAQAELPQPRMAIGLSPGVTLPSRYQEEISGKLKTTSLEISIEMHIVVKLLRLAWWSPAVTFLEESVTFLDSTLTAQAATIEQQP